MNLLAGPYDGEFGHELFSFQGRVRFLSKGYDEIAICTRPDMFFLYEDFADRFIPLGELNEKEYTDWDRIKPEDIRRRSGTGQVREEQEFTKYLGIYPIGDLDHEKYDIVVHARTKKAGMYSNLDPEVYNQLFKELKYNVAFVGTKDEAYCPNGATDLRGIRLSKLASVLNGARLTVGGSSGPIHYASLCGCPHLTWGGYRLRTFYRYAWDWNPFKTDCYILENADRIEYLKRRARLWKAPLEIFDSDYVNIIHCESYRKPTSKSLLENINKILNA